MTDPPALRSASAKARSDSGVEGELKSTSKAMSVVPASESLLINFACSSRGHGQTPIASMEGESMATTTTSPLACLGKLLKRRSRREYFNAVGTPVSRIATRVHTTKRCGRILFTPPHRMALAAQVLPRADVLEFAFRFSLRECNPDLVPIANSKRETVAISKRKTVAISEPECEAIAVAARVAISEPDCEAIAVAARVTVVRFATGVLSVGVQRGTSERQIRAGRGRPLRALPLRRRYDGPVRNSISRFHKIQRDLTKRRFDAQGITRMARVDGRKTIFDGGEDMDRFSIAGVARHRQAAFWHANALKR